MAKSSLRKKIRYFLGAFWLSAVVFLFVNMQAKNVSEALFEDDQHVRVSIESNQYVFTPTVDTSGVGLVFFPGALADPDAYVPLARDIAEAGFLVVIRKLPYRLAPFESHRQALFECTAILMSSETVERQWVIGGHSKGGALAAQFASESADALSGLLLIGTSHPRKIDMSSSTLDVVKLSGSRDGLASPDEVQIFKKLLPSSTDFIEIEGGNHAHFGWYGWQLGDRSATISRSRQHERTVQEVLKMLSRIASSVSSA